MKYLSLLLLFSSFVYGAENVKRYEMEAGTLTSGAVIKTVKVASGSQVVGDLQKKGASVEFIINHGSSAGTFDAKLAYACDRNMKTFMKVNEEKSIVELPSTSNWQRYKTLDLKLTLKPGENKISFTRGANLDYLEIYNSGLSTSNESQQNAEQPKVKEKLPAQESDPTEPIKPEKETISI